MPIYHSDRFNLPYENVKPATNDEINAMLIARDDYGNPISTIVLNKKIGDPVSAVMKVRAVDLMQYAYGDGVKAEGLKNERGDFWSEGHIVGKDKILAPKTYNNGAYTAGSDDETFEEKKKRLAGRLDRGHLLPNIATKAQGFIDANEVPQSAINNQEGSIRKAEEIMALFAYNSPNSEIEYSVTPDWRGAETVAAVMHDGSRVLKQKPQNLLIQVNGKHGKVSFYIPNTDDALHEPTRYMVNKDWIADNFPDRPELQSDMPDESGYVKQVGSYLRSVAGDLADKMPLKDAVKQAYLKSPIFKKQIKGK